jgi:protein-S-isoprenylcysteine O-methyltransferase Ste14
MAYFCGMLQAHVVLIFLWILFGVLHSVLAGLGMKQRFARGFPEAAKYYRLLYTFFAFLTLGGVVWYLAQLSSPFLFHRQLFTNAIGAVLTIVGLVIMGICIKKYFLSLSGLKSLFQERPSHQLMIGGIHRYVRHPLYLGTFLAVWGVALLYPLLSFFISALMITLYTLIGIRFEEKKLIAEFGSDYTTYRQTVPKLIPAFRRKPNS